MAKRNEIDDLFDFDDEELDETKEESNEVEEIDIEDDLPKEEPKPEKMPKTGDEELDFGLNAFARLEVEIKKGNQMEKQMGMLAKILLKDKATEKAYKDNKITLKGLCNFARSNVKDGCFCGDENDPKDPQMGLLRHYIIDGKLEEDKKRKEDEEKAKKNKEETDKAIANAKAKYPTPPAKEKAKPTKKFEQLDLMDLI